MYWLLGVGVLIVVALGIGIKMSTGGDSKAAESTAPAAPRKPVLDEKNARTADVKKWYDAMHDGNGFVVEQMSSLDKLKVQLALAPEKVLGNLAEAERTALKGQILDKLTKDKETELFRELEWASGELANEAMTTSSTGEVFASLNPKDDKKYRTGGRIKVEFEMVSGKAVVGGWSFLEKPEIKTDVKRAATAHKPIKEIGEIKQVQREIGGKVKTVDEAEIVPLGHLEGTPEPVRQEIDALVATMVDLEKTPKEVNKARARLKEIGKPAIPRLLTKFSEIPGKSHEEILALTQVVRLLQEMTGQGYGYSPDENSANEAQRLSALKQYYAWWSKNHDLWSGTVKADPEDEGTFGRAKPSRPKIPSETTSQPSSK
jgi:hypothetical protein